MYRNVEVRELVETLLRIDMIGLRHSGPRCWRLVSVVCSANLLGYPTANSGDNKQRYVVSLPSHITHAKQLREPLLFKTKRTKGLRAPKAESAIWRSARLGLSVAGSSVLWQQPGGWSTSSLVEARSTRDGQVRILSIITARTEPSPRSDNEAWRPTKYPNLETILYMDYFDLFESDARRRGSKREIFHMFCSLPPGSERVLSDTTEGAGTRPRPRTHRTFASRGPCRFVKRPLSC